MNPPPLILNERQRAARQASGTTTIFDVLADGEVVGRIYKANAAPVGSPWMWTLTFGHHEDRMPTHGFAATGAAARRTFTMASSDDYVRFDQYENAQLSLELVAHFAPLVRDKP
jgi:hypothetical protein